jgi:predicted transglutaminase-like cysteine proteinase
MSDKYGRREFLKTSGGTALFGIIAGCASSDSEPTQSGEVATPTPTDTPTPTPTETKTETPTPQPEENLEGLIGLGTENHLDFEQDRQIEREYTAYSEGNRTTFTKIFSEGVYEFYANQSRQYVQNYQYKYGSYVSDRLDKYLIDSIVTEFEKYGEEEDHNERQIIEHMMSLVQNLEYTTDKAGTGWNDYPKYPIETLVDQDGDCEDTAILMANLLRNFGYGTKLIYATGEMTEGDAGGHMAVGVLGENDIEGTYYEDEKGDRYYFIETTSPNTPIGQAPSWMGRAYLQPVGVHPVPGAVAAEITEVSGDTISVTGQTVNTGTVGTDQLQIRVSLIDSERYIIDQAVSDYKSVEGFGGNIDNLGSEHEALTELTLSVEQPSDLRLIAESLVAGSRVSQTESELRRIQ